MPPKQSGSVKRFVPRRHKLGRTAQDCGFCNDGEGNSRASVNDPKVPAVVGRQHGKGVSETLLSFEVVYKNLNRTGWAYLHP